ncbi:energy-coupling factor ABC transporter ATP-binding protein [Chthonomonas calidirosea]|uniref:energy-coupling factor ABC transporter ATP-binding protein n=1 Tax=Chthonomonas calidirosea TaxID=454171 RepID=UPI0006ECB019|nr:ABC transporter ATP-binding protein [Chthonomonas calidirosea]CEK19517.1 ABC-type cobalt transport system, ATPase component [Chthonomonas calidirosea]
MKPQQASSPVSSSLDNLFVLKQVSYRYNPETPALSNISVELRAGESVALLGANGCGKSTLLKLLGGLLFAQEGEVLAFGEPLTEAFLNVERNAHRFRRRVGFVFQNADAQLFSATVREELAFGPLHLGLPYEEVLQRVHDVARLVQVEMLLERPPFLLSHGEKRRVALGCVLATNPDVLLLDEPTTGLDPRSQVQFSELLQALHRAGKTLIISTHDLHLVPELAQRALIMAEDHTLAADIPTAQLFDHLDLLYRVNLIHEHMHRHGSIVHSHPHYHSGEHAHSHLPPLETPPQTQEEN